MSNKASSGKSGGQQQGPHQSSDFSDVSSEFDSQDEDVLGWVPYFLSLKGNEFFCQVDEDYIRDSFNLTGLVQDVGYYDMALDLICDIDNDEDLTDEQQEMVENDAEILYGLIHARFILTSRGHHAMLEKFRHCEFGRCPRSLCNDQCCLPIGVTDARDTHSVKLFCPRCSDIYDPVAARHKNIDGAYFGTTFPHLFFLVFPELKPHNEKVDYLPKIFGFQLHKTSHQQSLQARKKLQEKSQQSRR